MTGAGSGAAGTSRADRKRHTRALLVSAARRRVAADGFGALAVREMAREADIVPTAFYRHFATVDDLALQVADDAVSALRTLVDALVSTADDPAGTWPTEFADAGARHPETWPILARGLLDIDLPVHEVVETALDEGRRRLGIALSRSPVLADRDPDQVDALVDVVVVEVIRSPLEAVRDPDAGVRRGRLRLAALLGRG